MFFFPLRCLVRKEALDWFSRLDCIQAAAMAGESEELSCALKSFKLMFYLSFAVYYHFVVILIALSFMSYYVFCSLLLGKIGGKDGSWQVGLVEARRVSSCSLHRSSWLGCRRVQP